MPQYVAPVSASPMDQFVFAILALFYVSPYLPTIIGWLPIVFSSTILLFLFCLFLASLGKSFKPAKNLTKCIVPSPGLLSFYVFLAVHVALGVSVSFIEILNCFLRAYQLNMNSLGMSLFSQEYSQSKPLQYDLFVKQRVWSKRQQEFVTVAVIRFEPGCSLVVTCLVTAAYTVSNYQLPDILYSSWVSNLVFLVAYESLFSIVFQAGYSFIPRVSLIQVRPVGMVPLSSLFAVGINEDGQCGLDSDRYPCPSKFKKVESGDTVDMTDRRQFVKVACGALVTLGMTTEGNLYSYGHKDIIGRDGGHWTPGKVLFGELVSIVDAACTEYCCAALDTQGQIWSWGSFRDRNGKNCFRDNIKHSYRPIKLDMPEYIVQIRAGESHFVALGDSGNVYTWGNNDCCQLGPRFPKIGEFEPNLFEPRRLILDKTDIQPRGIGTSGFSTFVLGETGVLALGQNGFGELGLGNVERCIDPTPIRGFLGKKMVDVCGGMHHTLFLDSNQQVWGTGRNDDGQLGLGSSSTVVRPMQVAFSNSVGIAFIACGQGSQHSYAIDIDGNLFTSGQENYGQLGHGSDLDKVLHFAQVNLKGRHVYDVSGGCQFTMALLSPRSEHFS